MRGFSPRSPGARRRTEAGAKVRGHGVLPEGIFKIPERAMGIWGKSTTINQNFLHLFFLNPGDIKTSLYGISNYLASLYGQVYFTKKIFRLTVFSRGLYYQVDGNQDTFFENFINYIVIHIVLPK